jgi:hypothetical protein
MWKNVGYKFSFSFFLLSNLFLALLKLIYLKQNVNNIFIKYFKTKLELHYFNIELFKAIILHVVIG